MLKKARLLSVLVGVMAITSIVGIQGVHAAESGESVEQIYLSEGTTGTMHTYFSDDEFNGNYSLSDGRLGHTSGRNGQGEVTTSDGDSGYIKLNWSGNAEHSVLSLSGGTDGYGKGVYFTDYGWVSAEGDWYFLGSGGELATGWLQVNGSWYHFDDSGAMQTGWIKDGGSWYYLRSSGAMASNTSVGGYYLGSDGAWVG